MISCEDMLDSNSIKKGKEKHSKQSSLLCPAQWGSRFRIWPRRSFGITRLPWFPSPANFKGQGLEDSMGWAGPPGVWSSAWTLQVHTTDTPFIFLSDLCSFPEYLSCSLCYTDRDPHKSASDTPDWNRKNAQTSEILSAKNVELKQRPCTGAWIWMWGFKGHISWEEGHLGQSFPNFSKTQQETHLGERTKPREERGWAKRKSNDLPNSGFLSLGIIDIWEQIILYGVCGGGCSSMHCGRTLPPHPAPQLWQTRLSTKCPLEGKSAPDWELLT